MKRYSFETLCTSRVSFQPFRTHIHRQSEFTAHRSGFRRDDVVSSLIEQFCCEERGGGGRGDVGEGVEGVEGMIAEEMNLSSIRQFLGSRDETSNSLLSVV